MTPCRAPIPRLMWLIAILASACSDREDTDAQDARPPVEMPEAGVYGGTFPCADCPGIEVRLWLRPDGRFLLRQHYLTDDVADDGHFYALGLWEWHPELGQLVLEAPGPDRYFDVTGPTQLALRTTTDLPHLLTRLSDITMFEDTLPLDGEFSIRERRPVFRECHTGLTWPVSTRGDYPSLRHQYGAAPRGEALYVRLEGRLTKASGNDGASEVLVIERLIQTREGRSCP